MQLLRQLENLKTKSFSRDISGLSIEIPQTISVSIRLHYCFGSTSGRSSGEPELIRTKSGARNVACVIVRAVMRVQAQLASWKNRIELNQENNKNTFKSNTCLEAAWFLNIPGSWQFTLET